MRISVEVSKSLGAKYEQFAATRKVAVERVVEFALRDWMDYHEPNPELEAEFDRLYAKFNGPGGELAFRAAIAQLLN